MQDKTIGLDESGTCVFALCWLLSSCYCIYYGFSYFFARLYKDAKVIKDEVPLTKNLDIVWNTRISILLIPLVTCMLTFVHTVKFTQKTIYGGIDK